MAFDERQWRRSVRTASLRVRAPGGVPLLSPRGDPLLGAVIRSVGARPRPVLAIPFAAVCSHLLVVGTTGAGKTTTLVRLMAGFYAAAVRLARRARGPAPWVVVIDAKGGFDARDSAQRAREVLAGAGARRVAIWPDQASLNLWGLPPGRLAEVLTDMVPAAVEGPASFYADVLASVVGPGGARAVRPARPARRSSWPGSTQGGWPPRTRPIR